MFLSFLFLLVTVVCLFSALRLIKRWAPEELGKELDKDAIKPNEFKAMTPEHKAALGLLLLPVPLLLIIVLIWALAS